MKEAYYFSHDSNARHDPKILAMRSVYGTEGYGWYWIVIEMLREQEDYKIKIGKYTWNALAMQMQCNADAAHKFVSDCIEEFELLHSDSEYFWSNSLLKRMNKKNEKSEKARKAAAARWGKKAKDKGQDANSNKKNDKEKPSNADAMQTHSESNALKERKVKESKVKDITTITTKGDEVENEDEEQNSVTPEDADSFKQDETEEDILAKLNSLDEESPVDIIERHYANKVLRKNIVDIRDTKAIKEIYEKGYPVDFILKCIDKACEQYIERKGKLTIFSFNYFTSIIEEEWEKKKLKEASKNMNPKEPDVDLSKIKPKSNNYNSNNYGNKPKNRFHNFKQRPIQYSSEELKKKLGIKK